MYIIYKTTPVGAMYVNKVYNGKRFMSWIGIAHDQKACLYCITLICGDWWISIFHFTEKQPSMYV